MSACEKLNPSKQIFSPQIEKLENMLTKVQENALVAKVRFNFNIIAV